MRRLLMVCALALALVSSVSAQTYPSITAGPQTLLNAATTGTGATLNVNGKAVQLTVAIQATGTISGGTIVVEEAYYQTQTYTGTWSVIRTFTGATDFSTSSQTVFHSQAPAGYWKVRARIGSSITGGGTVTVTAWTN